MENSVSVTSVTKRYGKVTALDGVSLQISSGKVYGILGPNGSGKTTLLRLINSIIYPDSGEIIVNGMSTVDYPDSIKSIIGYVPETPVLYESLTPDEYFSFIISARNIDPSKARERINKMINAFDLASMTGLYIGSLSFGNRQKVAIISSLIHDPAIVIMDEGMNGLDPRSSRILRTLFSEFASRGKTVIISTHVLEVAQELCDFIYILYKGRIVASGSIEELRRQSGENGNLEDIFLKETESFNINDIVQSLRESF